jgi:FAD/FMN-containing dehydrogenase
VLTARDEGLDLSVRGGGHSAPGFGTNDGGIVADLSPLQDVVVNTDTKTARAGGGCTWKVFNEATHADGVATTGGIIGTTGIAGLTLGGGIGYLSRNFGLSCDNLLSAEVVTAAGEVVTASETHHADLFWALRGGGGNFGVVTTFEYRVHPVAEIYGGPIAYPVDRAEDVLRFYREFIAEAPEEFGGFVGFHLAPPLPFLPEEWHFKNVCLAVLCWAGPVEEGEKRVQPFLDVVEPVGAHVGAMPYPALNTAFDALLPPGLQQYWKSSFERELSDEAIAVHAEYGATVPTINTAVHLYPINGAVQRVGDFETAFPFRDGGFSPVIAGVWENPADNAENIEWVRAYFSALAPHSAEGGYINFMDSDDEGRTKVNYGANYDRLAAAKAKYDPDNVFHMNHNIEPAP